MCTLSLTKCWWEILNPCVCNISYQPSQRQSALLGPFQYRNHSVLKGKVAGIKILMTQSSMVLWFPGKIMITWPDVWTSGQWNIISDRKSTWATLGRIPSLKHISHLSLKKQNCLWQGTKQMTEAWVKEKLNLTKDLSCLKYFKTPFFRIIEFPASGYLE